MLISNRMCWTKLYVTIAATGTHKCSAILKVRPRDLNQTPFVLALNNYNQRCLYVRSRLADWHLSYATW